MNISPAVVGPPAAMPVAKAKAQPEPALPSFLLIDPPPPKPRNLWPIAFMLLFIGTAAWAFYIHKTTGSYPAFINTLTSGARQLPQTLRDLKPSPSTGQGKPAPADQSSQSTTTSGPNPANDAGAQSAGTTDHAAGADPQMAPGGPGDATPSSTGTPEGQSGGPSDGSGVPVMTTQASPQTPSPQSGTVPSVAPENVSGTVADNTERSPFSPVGANAKTNPSLAPPTVKKPRPPVTSVDGFTKKNIPELLRVADIAARRGDYRLASYEYNLILKLDHTNDRARIGLRLIQAGERVR